VRDRLNLAFPSALLVIVAVTQIVRAHTIRQSPWKGGGFGMFASADTPNNRVVRCWIVTPEGEERVDVPPYMDDLALTARYVPTRANLIRLAEALETGKWIQATETIPSDIGTREGIQDPSPGPEDGRPGPRRGGVYLIHLRKGDPEPPDAVQRVVIGVRVQALRLAFENQGPALSVRVLNEARSGQE
jgi:hypothetical protein